MQKTQEKVRHSLILMLRDLGPTELKEAADFILFLKTRTLIDPSQTYFWTNNWQALEQKAEVDKRRRRIVGDGSLPDLLRKLKS